MLALMSTEPGESSESPRNIGLTWYLATVALRLASSSDSGWSSPISRLDMRITCVAFTVDLHSAAVVKSVFSDVPEAITED